jgi:glucuronosyltransferase
MFSILTFCAILSSSQAAKILGIFHYPSYSHQIVYQSLVKDLSERGHHLTILTADRMNSNHPNITEIYLENSYDENINFVESRGFGGLKLTFALVKATLTRMNQQLSQPEVQELIVNHTKYNFDLIILEYLFLTPIIAFAEVYDCPVIAMSAIGISAPVHELFGNPVNPAIHPEVSFPYQHGRLKFTERISSFIYHVAFNLFLLPIFNNFGTYIMVMLYFSSLIIKRSVTEKILGKINHDNNQRRQKILHLKSFPMT